jgi:hypothetical protein
MQAKPRPVDLLQELEARQDEVLEQLEALNQRLEMTLAQYAPKVPTPSPVATSRVA